MTPAKSMSDIEYDELIARASSLAGGDDGEELLMQELMLNRGSARNWRRRGVPAYALRAIERLEELRAARNEAGTFDARARERVVREIYRNLQKLRHRVVQSAAIFLEEMQHLEDAVGAECDVFSEGPQWDPEQERMGG